MRKPGDNIRDIDPIGAAIIDELMEPSPGWSGFPVNPAAVNEIIKAVTASHERDSNYG